MTCACCCPPFQLAFTSTLLVVLDSRRIHSNHICTTTPRTFLVSLPRPILFYIQARIRPSLGSGLDLYTSDSDRSTPSLCHSSAKLKVMAANRNRRLAKEIQDVQKDSHSGVSLEPLNKAQTGSDTLDDLTHFKGVFRGPPDTPYHGATYNVDIKIPNDYPFQPPVMKFTTKIWHPNISSVTVRPTTTPA